ncbi:hypothetical protein PYW08_003787 [Mythimna loreyi]|uniref:Uncharacterized protein n=1 Tax=Mythimna loreyi TaxID=667449 RepID=A0ACC2QYS1_9NEOP|nr:hypothetical protein PYW08_003787 [Mythimna loreyi]
MSQTETALETKSIDSANFEETVSSILCGIGAQKYIDIFKKQNIDQFGLSELSDEDLTALGIVEPEIRKQIIEHAKLIPAHEETVVCTANLAPKEIVEVFEECAKVLHRIHLSMVASNVILTKTKNVPDCLLYKDKYASNIALSTLNEMAMILNSMDNSIHTQLKMKTNKRNSKKKKIIVGTVGSAVIVMLAVLFARSLKQLN